MIKINLPALVGNIKLAQIVRIVGLIPSAFSLVGCAAAVIGYRGSPPDVPAPSAGPSGSYPVYGCWCGSGQPAPTENPRPVDEWDAICMHHDLCYRSSGRDNAKCDDNFVSEIEAQARLSGTVPMQMQVAYTYFSTRRSPFFVIGGVGTPFAGYRLVDAARDCMK